MRPTVKSDDAGTVPVILAVVTTDRPRELARLIRSLDPVANDRHVHLMVLDNGSDDRDRTLLTPAVSSMRSAGTWSVVRSSRAHLPLHAARMELSIAAAALANALSDTPIVWMLDDDLTFEEVRADHGTLAVRNVAEERIASARALARTDIDVLVSGFTGDPPIRPEGVLANQMVDLIAALKFAKCAHPDSPWPVAIPYFRSRDDFYDFSDSADPRSLRTAVPWLLRSHVPATVAGQFALLLSEACSIRRGCTPFRPLTASHTHTPMRVRRADRGGNCIFRTPRTLLAHPYPAFAFGGRFTRRADMVGLNVLARQPGTVVATGDLALRHDRSDQPPLTGDFGPLVADFAGVLLSRATAREHPDAADTNWIAQVTADRAARIARALACARDLSRECLQHLATPAPWWRQLASVKNAADALCAELECLVTVLSDHNLNELTDQLRSTALQNAVLAALDTLRSRAV